MISPSSTRLFQFCPQHWDRAEINSAVSKSGKLEHSPPSVFSGVNFDACGRRGGTPPRGQEGRVDKILPDRSQVKTRTSGRTGGEGNVCKICCPSEWSCCRLRNGRHGREHPYITSIKLPLSISQCRIDATYQSASYLGSNPFQSGRTSYVDG